MICNKDKRTSVTEGSTPLNETGTESTNNITYTKFHVVKEHDTVLYKETPKR